MPLKSAIPAIAGHVLSLPDGSYCNVPSAYPENLSKPPSGKPAEINAARKGIYSPTFCLSVLTRT
jgi:hypothetical protein